MIKNIFVPKLNAVDIKSEGTKVHLLYNGRLVFSVPWDAALKIAAGLYAKAKQAEEIAKAEQIIADQAILTRAGFGIGLTNNRYMQKQALNEAAWNSDLRRYIPASIKTKERLGTPSIINHGVKRNG